MSANQKDSSNNRDFPFVSFTKKNYNHTKSILANAIYFEGTNVCVQNIETKFLCKTGLYYMDSTTGVNKSFYQRLVKQNKVINTGESLKLDRKLFLNCSRVSSHISCNHKYRDCQD